MERLPVSKCGLVGLSAQWISEDAGGSDCDSEEERARESICKSDAGYRLGVRHRRRFSGCDLSIPCHERSR